MCYKYPQWANQPLASCGVIIANASATAWSRSSRVRAALARKMALNFDQHGGLSFEYKKSRIQGNTFNGPGTGIHLLANSAQSFVHGNFSTDNQTAILDEGTNNHLEGNFAV
jgi:nitrous oxidase accessory protein NosD